MLFPRRSILGAPLCTSIDIIWSLLPYPSLLMSVCAHVYMLPPLCRGRRVSCIISTVH